MNVNYKNLKEYDNHEQVVRVECPLTGLRGFIAIHSKRGKYPSIGATRFWKYDSEVDALKDALRLSKLMSYKSAMAGLPYGGAKAVIMNGPGTTKTKRLLFKAYAKKVNELEGAFVTGSDVGVSQEDLSVMCDNSNYIIGGEVPAGDFTALGIAYAIEEVLGILYESKSVEGRSFAVQGLGKTGYPLVRYFFSHGAKDVFVSEIDQDKIERVRKEFPNVTIVPDTEIHKQKVDVFSPCALSHVVREDNIDELACRSIVGAANNQLQNLDLAEKLHQKNILYVPDYIVNSGGMVSVIDEYEHGAMDEERVEEKLRNMQKQVQDLLLKSSKARMHPSSFANIEAERIFSKPKDNTSLLSQYIHNVSDLSKQLKIRKENFWEGRGQRMALGLFHAMAGRVPAYSDFLKKNGIQHEKIKTISDFEKVPTVDKDNYLRQYSLDALSWDGKLSTKQSSFAATSGSTGEPFYFPRQRQHDLLYSLIAELYLRENFSIHKKKTLYVNCFALGIWIGGLFTYEAITSVMQRKKYNLSIINPGMDKQKAIASIRAIGKHYDQVIIGGYPPLVKDLIDEGVDEGLVWSDYSIGFIFSAEGFSDEFRNYVLGKSGVEEMYKSSLNHYGTVDFGTMSHETPLCLLLRKEMSKNSKYFEDFFGQIAKLPTLTQYIPELFYFQQEDMGLVCSSNAGIPLVRYDLKDRGGVRTIASSMQIAKKHNVDISKKISDAKIKDTIWNLPFVYVYERSDFSVSLYGANIYPESVRKVLEKKPYSHLLTGKFSMCIKFDTSQNQYLEINVECKRGTTWGVADKEKLAKKISNKLVHENSEYRNNLKEIGDRVIPQIVSWPNEHQKYFGNKGKQKWVIK